MLLLKNDFNGDVVLWPEMAPVVIIGFLVIIVFYLAFELFLMLLKVQQAPAKTAQNPNSAKIKPVFNKIKQPAFKDATPSDTVKNYVMDTLDGSPITATESANIYFIPQKSPSFGFLQKIYFMAKSAGFDTDVTKHKLTDDRTALFYDGLRSLTIDISNFNFNYQYTISNDNIKLTDGKNVIPSTIEDTAINFLRDIDRYPEELAQGKRNTSYFHLNIDTKELTPVQTLEEANMAEVDFFRPDIDGLPVVTPKYYNSPHFVVVAFTESGLQVVRAQVSLYEKSNDQVGIYPLKTGAVAFDDLKKGKGYIVSSSNNLNKDNVKIKSMFLAELDYDDYEEYLQPVFVFLGEGNFVAYVPAVTADYLAQ